MNRYSEHHIQAREILNEVKKLGETKESEKLLLEGLNKYPDNICIKKALMQISLSLYMQDKSNDYYKELVEKLALELKNNEIYKYDAIQILAYLYRILGRQDEIYEDVNNLPSVWQSRELLMPEVLKWEARIKAVQKNFILLINLFDSLLLSTYGREEVGKRDKILLKEKVLIDEVFENGDYGIINNLIQNIYYRCARDQAYVNNREKTIEYLRESVKYAKAYDDFRFNTKKIKHTSFLVDRLEEELEDYIFSVEQSLTEFMNEALKDELFDFIREDEEFKQIVTQLNK